MSQPARVPELPDEPERAARRLAELDRTGLSEVATPLPSAHAINALVHLHRAEVGRLTAYRIRMDTTTNWAISTSALVVSFTLANPQIPHVAILLLLGINYFFLHLEARRFRAYEATRHRVHLLERGFYPQLIGGPADPHWSNQLIAALRNPGLTVDLLGALSWRLRRNYLWINLLVILAWVGELYLRGGPAYTAEELLGRAAFGLVPGQYIVGAVCVYALALVMIAVGAERIYPLGDEEERQLMKRVVDE
jgi:uncharacterized membrane protein